MDSPVFFLIYHKAILEENYYNATIGYSLMVGLFPFLTHVSYLHVLTAYYFGCIEKKRLC